MVWLRDTSYAASISTLLDFFSCLWSEAAATAATQSQTFVEVEASAARHEGKYLRRNDLVGGFIRGESRPMAD